MLKYLLAGTALIVLCTSGATAAPLAAAPVERPPIILVSGGCGFAFHRTPFGTCAPNRRVFVGAGPVVVVPGRLPPPCPRGYYRDPDPLRRICYPIL